MSKLKQKLLGFVDNNEIISRCLLKLRIRDSREAKRPFRTVYINNQKPASLLLCEKDQEPLPYTSNQIRTSKYRLWNFLFINLFEQFRRVANFYFLVNIIIILVVPNPPTSPFAAILPLTFVISLTAIKQAYEDILRHKMDTDINNSETRILRNGKFETQKWKDIKVGDVVEVRTDEQFPCDLLLLNCATETNDCHITTANLDGETNLKKKSVPNFPIPCKGEEELASLRGFIQCDKPNLNLYEFNGKILVDEKEIYVMNDNILLRGCTLKLAPYIHGVAIYTGSDTKMMLNSKFKSNKMSCIERRLNQFVLVFLTILALLTLSSLFGSIGYYEIYSTAWYLKDIEPSFYSSNTFLYYLCIVVLYMSLYNYIVPLSMYVTIELQRFVGSQFLEWDLEMYDEKTDQPAKANSSDLNEDLGQVEYLFSDKTGTLTENEMQFKQFSVDGAIYEEKEGGLYQIGTSERAKANPKLDKFLKIMSLCHTVQVDQNMTEIYQASSPDEFSFVKFCAKIGIVFVGDKKDKVSQKMVRSVHTKSSGEITDYELLQVFEFDSTRKRMSVIVREIKSKKVILMCKGAESSIFKCCTSGDIQTCDANIKKFSELGWRTLALAYRELSEAEYQKIATRMEQAYGDIMKRNQQLESAFNDIESGLELIGATAVEDKLQENVAETLESLRIAGIKIWVLTGDKKETAINISNSCKHFSGDMIKLEITDLKDVEMIKKRIEHCDEIIRANKNESYALIIDGETLGHLFKEEALKASFRETCMKCDAVLCCRMSPSQKAEVVKLVKHSKLKPMTAAIGDGANDVSMIQEAHVGLGIFGKEGRNAARSADFAFAKFKFVRRILLVHGYLYYTRASLMTQYFFYKNMTFAICQFYYSFSNAFSVTSLYGSLVLTLYNVVFTSAPILLFGLFEQRVPIKILDKSPHLYRTIAKNKYLRKLEFFKWNFLALWHSLVSYFFSYSLFRYGSSLSSDGMMESHSVFSGIVTTMTIVVVHCKLFIEWHAKGTVLIAGYTLSFLGYVIFCIVTGSFIIPYPFTTVTDNQQWYWIYLTLLSRGSVWFCMFLIIVVAMTPDLIIKIVEEYYSSQKALKQIESKMPIKEHPVEINKQSSVISDPTTSSSDHEEVKLNIKNNSAKSIKLVSSSGVRPRSTKVHPIEFIKRNYPNGSTKSMLLTPVQQ